MASHRENELIANVIKSGVWWEIFSETNGNVQTLQDKLFIYAHCLSFVEKVVYIMQVFY